MKQTGLYISLVILAIVVAIAAIIFCPLLLLWCLKVLGVPVITYSFKQWAAALFISMLLGGTSRIASPSRSK